jgi:hypothetical protein
LVCRSVEPPFDALGLRKEAPRGEHDDDRRHPSRGLDRPSRTANRDEPAMTELQEQPHHPAAPEPRPHRNTGCLRVGLLMLLTVVVSVGLTIWLLTTFIFPKELKPVELSSKEETLLSRKLQQFGVAADAIDRPVTSDSGEIPGRKLQPEPYSESGAKREVSFSERELNALLAKNTDLADKLAIDLTDRLASAKLLFPIDPDFPVLGGKILNASAGLELAYEGERPIVILKGVSIWGVPVPNAWLGGLKNVDLVREFGGQEGFWKSFADGIENIRIEQGSLVVKLKE